MPLLDDGGTVVLNDISQGVLSNCEFWASVSAITTTNPDAIRGVFSNEQQETADLRFFLDDGGTRTVTVSKAFTRGVETAHPSNDFTAEKYEVWPQVLENGYRQVFGENINNVTAEDVLRRLTGETVNVKPVGGVGGLTREQLESQVRAAFENGQAVVFGTKQNMADARPLVADHGYALKAIQGDMVILFNPWGVLHPVPPLSFADLHSAIEVVRIQ